MKAICKKKPLLFFILLIFSGNTIEINAEDSETASAVRTREISKDFTVNKNANLEIENRYGNITVTHWDKKQVNIRVVIESKAKNEERAEAGLARVQIDMKQKGNTIYASTSFARTNNNNRNPNEQQTVHYYVTIPKELNLKLDQRYGNIYLPEENAGKCNLTIKYGNIQSGSFLNMTTIDAAYSNISLKKGGKMDMSLAYCGDVKFDDMVDLAINAKYSGLKGGAINHLKVNKSYSNLVISEVDKCTLDVRYGNVDIHKVNTELKVGNLSYSNLNVKEVSGSFKEITISAQYGNVTLRVPEKTIFTIEAKNMKYADFRLNKFNTTHTHVEAPDYYKYQVNGGGSSFINFNGNNYSNITINSF